MPTKDQSVPQCSLPASSLCENLRLDFSRDSINAATGHSISFFKRKFLKSHFNFHVEIFSQTAEAAGREPDARGQQRFV